MTVSQSHILSAVLGGLGAFGALVATSTYLNSGVLEYPLDDAYIHLAMAEQVYAGGYGVNAGEYASAASSPLYPLLLPTWAGMTVQAWLPFVWNVLFVLVAAGLLGWAIGRAEIPKIGPGIAALAPAALAVPVVAATGMENMGHGAASLAILFGLWKFVETGKVGWFLGLGVVLAPAFRLEGLALGLAAAGVVFLLGQPRKGIALGLLALAPVILFVAALTSLGLDPLPNSVNAKLPDPKTGEAGWLARLGTTFSVNIAQYGGRFVFALMISVGLMAVLAARRGLREQGLVALAVVAAAGAHLAVASVGWMDRYENYLVLTLFAALALLVVHYHAVIKFGVVGAALIGSAMTYAPQIDNYAYNPNAIFLQQAQMARFAKEHVKAPVAVNDLGYVAWNNPDHVLDLWGLASADALATRLSSPPDGWADPLADARDVQVAMIYDAWLPNALGPDWVPLGTLQLFTNGLPFLGGVDVSFYARSREIAQRLEPEITGWSAGLPRGAVFVPAGADKRP